VTRQINKGIGQASDNTTMSRDLIILISGKGSTMKAIVEAALRERWAERLGAQVRAVISNRPDALGLQTAAAMGIATTVVDHKAFGAREDFELALIQAIEQHSEQPHPTNAPPIIVLAGFMRVLTAGFVDRYAGRLVNIHPSLLPHFPGLHTHQRALDAGHTQAGSTVHWVTAVLDHGPVLGQAVVPILLGDDANTLAARVQAAERELYPRVLSEILSQNLDKYTPN
jgi:phosphoribosylglycinamide formyltransferase 1